ncbi:MAG: DUF5060 domain-containing protein [Planctomycetes bacterium]|nr:DUF5060 domain-containing protein [Planctomycetota bacterium]
MRATIPCIAAVLGAALSVPAQNGWSDLHVLPAAGVFEPVELAFDTAATAPGGLNERSATPNHPWLDYRLTAWFISSSGRVHEVPGFYAADGRGGNAGSVWKVRFTPDQAGYWGVYIQFEYGLAINVQDGSVRGVPLRPDGQIFLMWVPPRTGTVGFLRHGPLEVVGGRYLRHRDGTWFLKTGTNSPENLLAYAGFDGASDYGGLPRSATFLHRYPGHVRDWRPGDPNWTSGGDPNAGKGIIGALNYLHDHGVNSVYFLPMNLGGDGQDVHPFVDGSTSSYFNTTHYDVGRMEQWNAVFAHAQRLGILLEFVLAEREPGNIGWLGGANSNQRRLFLKNLVAMFGYHPGVRWILCEENSPEPTQEFLVRELSDMAEWIRIQSTHRHPIAVHSDPDDQLIFEQILAQGPRGRWLTSFSLQVHSNYNPSTEAARALLDRFSQPGVVDMDELGTAIEGVTNTNRHDIRRLVLWDVLLSGGNVAWYMGYHDLPLGGDIRLEDFRTREGTFDDSRAAREMLETMPFWRMEPADDLVTGETVNSRFGDAEVFAEPGQLYVVYFADTLTSGMIDLSAAPSGSTFTGTWYDPKTGQQVGASFTRAGGGQVWLPTAPSPTYADWLLVLRRQ